MTDEQRGTSTTGPASRMPREDYLQAAVTQLTEAFDFAKSIPNPQPLEAFTISEQIRRFLAEFECTHQDWT